MINSQEYQTIASALSLLNDYINNFCGEECYPDDQEVLKAAENLLREYENNQGSK